MDIISGLAFRPFARYTIVHVNIKPATMKQLSFLKKGSSAYGGELLKTRKGRSRPRPLATRETMHLVLRSSKAKGNWSFRHPRHLKKIRSLVERFSEKHGVRVISMANVGNHLHFHIRLTNRYTYRPFIRALTGAIAMAVTGAKKGKKLVREAKDRFWDYRPWTRIIQGLRSILTLKDYIEINQCEGLGFSRSQALWLVRSGRYQGEMDTS